jgi:hypothetical protein
MPVLLSHVQPALASQDPVLLRGEPSNLIANWYFWYENKPSGVDVMITIFCDFSNTYVMINFFKKITFVLSQKRQFFRKFFRRKYF